jgi:hypothetical protein
MNKDKLHCLVMSFLYPFAKWGSLAEQLVQPEVANYKNIFFLIIFSP